MYEHCTSKTPFRLSARTRRAAGGRIVVGGWPPRYIRLSASGAAALDAILDGRPAHGAAALSERLLKYAMLDPVAGQTTADVTFVVPVRNGGPALVLLVGQLIEYGPVLVVDDGSSDGSPEFARRAGATVVPNDGPAGPGGARNTGWRLADSEFIAFIDADCHIAGDWARPLAGLLASGPELALVAPRVRGNSPLDMGDAGGLVGPERRVPFAPSAALVARRSALSELDGFDGALRFGEDVDLVWRAVAGGWSVRYAPEIEVEHPPRPTLRLRLRQQYEYGTSAALLEQRHPGCAAPLRLSGTVLPIKMLRRGTPPRRDILPLFLESQRTCVQHLARAISRDWLPLSLLAATQSRRARPFVLASIALDVATATAPLDAAIRIGDNAAYCAGLWRGALRQRSIRAILPRWQRR